MARDTRTRSGKSSGNRPARKSSGGGLPLKWLASLAAVGSFVGFIVYLNSVPTPDPQATPTATAPVKPAPQTAKPAQPTQQRPDFRFYEMLPDTKVIPSNVDDYRPAPSPEQQNIAFVLQTGSFRSAADAERQRAQIAFQGLHAKVDVVTLESGVVWHRVSVGPYSSRSEMNRAMDRLVAINIQPLVRRVSTSG
ncbi:MAG: SPOR domain-containing protein [Marinobacter sp.]|nr:SPOR domain-containing protein [Marinobacter sp.]